MPVVYSVRGSVKLALSTLYTVNTRQYVVVAFA